MKTRKGPMPVPAEVRFWRFVEKTPKCWLWKGHRNEKGYGYFAGKKCKTVLAARYAYNLLVGEIPFGLTIDHTCNTTSCVNPLHLRPMGRVENTMRGNSPASQNARKKKCLNGHALPAPRIYNGKRQRICVECQNTRSRKCRSNHYQEPPHD